jgi:hypothetical protein
VRRLRSGGGGGGGGGGGVYNQANDNGGGGVGVGGSGGGPTIPVNGVGNGINFPPPSPCSRCASSYNVMLSLRGSYSLAFYLFSFFYRKLYFFIHSSIFITQYQHYDANE